MKNTNTFEQNNSQTAPISPILRNKVVALGLIGFGLFSFLVMMVSYKTETLFYVLDQPLLEYFDQYRQNAPEWVDTIAEWLSRLGSQGITVLTIVILAIWAYQRQARYFFTMFVGVVGMELLWLALIFGFGRPRPEEVISLVGIKMPSFPSGHVMIFIVFFGVLIYLFFTRVQNKFWRYLIVLALLVALLITGFFRLYFSAHYFTDIIAGYGIGLFWLIVSLWAVDWYFFKVKGIGSEVPSQSETVYQVSAKSLTSFFATSSKEESYDKGAQ